MIETVPSVRAAIKSEGPCLAGAAGPAGRLSPAASTVGRKGRRLGKQGERVHARLPSRCMTNDATTSQQPLISAVFEVAERATNDLTHLVPDLDRDSTEYALASVLLEEAWVSAR